MKRGVAGAVVPRLDPEQLERELSATMAELVELRGEPAAEILLDVMRR